MWYIGIKLTVVLFGEWIEDADEVSFKGGGELDVLPYWGNKMIYIDIYCCYGHCYLGYRFTIRWRNSQWL